MPCSFYTQALSAKTTRAIEGSAPYLTFDGGRTKVTSNDDLLAIKLPDGTKITPSSNTSSATNPILITNGSTFDDIHMALPLGVNTVSLSDLITQGNWGDDDGDGQGTNGVTAIGSISVSFTDNKGDTVSRRDSLDLCKAPYKVILRSYGGARLETLYGVPNTNYFSNQTVTYYINPNSPPKVCYARPNRFQMDGSANMWNGYKGFLVQSTSLPSYGLNFPTTGADGLFFDLDIAGVDASQLTWSSVSHGGITATVTWGKPNDNDYWISDKSQYVTRVTLRGPRADSARIQSANPSPLSIPSLPQIFELEGKDSRDNVVVKYGFELRQWFVNRADKKDTPSGLAKWCSSLGYRLPRIRDLTNAKCGVQDNNGFPCVEGIDGATPSSGTPDYRRHIGAGFFSEWGTIGQYADAGFRYFSGYWTSDSVYDTYFDVNSNSGYVYRYRGSVTSVGVCTTP
ncbi:hypothetical protein A9G24_04755 [Gilliamella sp. App6-5]|uniref:hypothetical protein n=1 Tax=Gilliamella sp. App6-5 TaxID=3120232 RepID=UPI000828A919|nr:hypothetical protein [Gilliamella apicola]OCG16311.1 hypothetical protein A9G24_04755 [Gilliamella apicola]